MGDQMIRLAANIRIWQDERLGRLWRAALRDGDEETVVTFPDFRALADFLSDHLGLNLLDNQNSLGTSA
jgi:hypothetical protein